MSFNKNIWDQLKGLTAGSLIAALEQDGWVCDTTKGSIQTFIKHTESGNKRVQVHFHGANKGWGRSLLKKMLSEIGWTEQDLKKLKLVK